MRRRTAATASVLDPPPEIILTPEQMEEQERQELERKDFWQMHNALSIAEKEISKIYVYRLVWPDNASKPAGEDNNIDMIASHLFDRELLTTKHGGGKYQLWHKSKLNGPKFNFKRVVNFPGLPAKIPRRYIIVEEDGSEVMPADKSAAAAPADMGAVFHQANIASQTANAAASEALKAGMELITRAAGESIAIVSNSMKRDSAGDVAGSAVIAEIRAEMKDLKESIKDQKISNLEKQIQELREERSNPAKAPSEVAAVAETAKLFGIEGGFSGMVKTLSSAESKEEGVLDYIGKGLGEGLKSIFTEWGGQIVQLGREYIHLRHVEAVQRNQPGATPPPAPQAIPSRPGLGQAPQAHPAQQQPPADREPTQEEFIMDLTRQITSTIRYFIERNFDGAGVADVVKDKFRLYMTFLPQLEIFKDFNKLMEFCRTNEDLRDFVDVPEFAQFAKDFWQEFQPEAPAAAGGGPAANPPAQQGE